jgi:hypothetical protein
MFFGGKAVLKIETKLWVLCDVVDRTQLAQRVSQWPIIVNTVTNAGMDERRDFVKSVRDEQLEN